MNYSGRASYHSSAGLFPSPSYSSWFQVMDYLGWRSLWPWRKWQPRPVMIWNGLAVLLAGSEPDDNSFAPNAAAELRLTRNPNGPDCHETFSLLQSHGRGGIVILILSSSFPFSYVMHWRSVQAVFPAFALCVFWPTTQTAMVQCMWDNGWTNVYLYTLLKLIVVTLVQTIV